MKISVLMSTYNGEKYIEEQLKSLLNQSYKIDEIVIVDDCSADHTVQVIRDFIASYGLEDFIRLSANRENKGWRTNFFNGIEKTSGDYIFFCDQDDIWFNNKVELTVKVLEENSSVQVVASHETIWDGVHEEKSHADSACYKIVELDASGSQYLIHCSGCTMAFRRSYYDQIKVYYTTNWAHDDFFWKMAVTDGSFALLDTSTILHRIHGGNESRKQRTYESTIVGTENDIRVARQVLKYLNENESIRRSDEKKNVVNHKLEGFLIRKDFFERKKFLDFFRMALLYPDIYRRKRQIVRDFQFVYARKKKK